MYIYFTHKHIHDENMEKELTNRDQAARGKAKLFVSTISLSSSLPSFFFLLFWFSSFSFRTSVQRRSLSVAR